MSLKKLQIYYMQGSRNKIQLFLVGSSYSGKSTLFEKLKTGKFIQQQPNTLSPVVYHYETNINDIKYNVQVWDTQGFDRNPGILRIPQYKKAKGFIIMYDITEKKSFQNVQLCVNQIKNFCPVQNQHMLLIGNKKDLQKEREVSFDQAMQYTQQQGIQLRQISVKSYQHQKIKKIFHQRVKLLASKVVADLKKDQAQRFVLKKSQSRLKIICETLWNFMSLKCLFRSNNHERLIYSS